MTLNNLNAAIHDNAGNNSFTLIQTASNGILQKNTTGYQLMINKPDPWLTYFNQILTAQPQLKSANFMAQNQYYKTMRRAFKTSKSSSFNAKIIALNNNNDIIQYNAHIKKIIHNPASNQVNYQLDLPTDNNNKAFLIHKTLLKHIVILIDGNGICINCGGPW